MRILLLSTGGKIGGEETFTRNLAISLKSAGHSVLVAPGGGVQQADLEKRGIEICPVNISSRSPLGLLKASKKIVTYIEHHNIDIVHAQAIGPAIMGVLAKRFYKCNTPWIWHNHGITDFAYKHIVKRLNKLDRIIANSDYVRECLKGHGVKPSVITRIHNGINYSDYFVSEEDRVGFRKRIHDEISVDDSARIIIYVGRLSPEKGVEVLLKSFEQYASTTTDTHCVLVGDGIEKSNLLAQIQSYKCKNQIHFLGFRSDIKELVSGSDVLVLPSHIETFSLTTLQAFASGTPCIGSDVGGTPEQILDKFSGRLFPDNDTTVLVECLHDILDNPDKAVYYSTNARSLSMNYLNSDRMTTDIINVYNTLIDLSKR